MTRKRPPPSLLITLWNHLGCNLSHDAFDSIYKVVRLRWQFRRTMKEIRKTMTPEQIRYLDSLK